MKPTHKTLEQGDLYVVTDTKAEHANVLCVCTPQRQTTSWQVGMRTTVGLGNTPLVVAQGVRDADQALAILALQGRLRD